MALSRVEVKIASGANFSGKSFHSIWNIMAAFAFCVIKVFPKLGMHNISFVPSSDLWFKIWVTVICFPALPEIRTARSGE